MRDYKIAAICLKGHCYSSHLNSNNLPDQYCSICGKRIITKCPACSKFIRGSIIANGLLIRHYTVPSYCYYCSEPFPWTQLSIDAVAELITEESELDEIQKQKLIDSLPDIVAETPETGIAVTRMTKALLTVGKFTADGLRQFAIDVGCEVAKSRLGL